METTATKTTAPNAVRALWKASGKSANRISAEIEERFGVRIHGSAIRRFARDGTGIGKELLPALAEFFDVRVWELYDPTLPEKTPKKFASIGHKLLTDR